MDKKILIKHIGEDWYPILSPVFKKHWEIVKALINAEKRPITPELGHIFRAYELCRVDKLKCIVLGADPYNGLIGNTRVADGIAFSSVNSGGRPPRDLSILQQSWSEITDKTAWKKDTDLSHLADQGVLLLNSYLTTIVGQNGAHKDIWKEFTQDCLKAVTAHVNVPVVLLGAEAKKFDMYINPLTCTIFEATHPSSAIYNDGIWEHNDVFKKVNEFINETNGFQYEVQWLN